MSVYRLEVTDINSAELDLNQVNLGIYYFLNTLKPNLMIGDVNLIRELKDFPLVFRFYTNFSDKEVIETEQTCLKPLEDYGLTYKLEIDAESKDLELKHKEKARVPDLTSLLGHRN